MKFNATAQYPLSASALADLLATQEFIEHKVKASRPVSFEATIEGASSGAFTVKTTRVMPTDQVPDAFKRFVGQGIELHMVEEWGAAEADGSRHATLKIKVAGMPASATGNVLLRATGPESCEVTYFGELKVSIPLIGGKIESMATAGVDRALELERQATVEWLNA